MTSKDLQGLLQIARQRERLAKTAAARSAELLADFERQIAAEYPYDDDATWKAAAESANAAVDEAKKMILARCRELGIPREFAPTMSAYWYNRGENACSKCRAELRRVAQSRIEASEKEARLRIQAASLRVQEQLLTDGLTSEAAREFLQTMPTAEMLVPALKLTTIEAFVPRRETEEDDV